MVFGGNDGLTFQHLEAGSGNGSEGGTTFMRNDFVFPETGFSMENAIDEMVHLMSAYREFEAVQRTLKTLMTDMNSKLIQELGKLS